MDYDKNDPVLAIGVDLDAIACKLHWNFQRKPYEADADFRKRILWAISIFPDLASPASTPEPSDPESLS